MSKMVNPLRMIINRTFLVIRNTMYNYLEKRRLFS